MSQSYEDKYGKVLLDDPSLLRAYDIHGRPTHALVHAAAGSSSGAVALHVPTQVGGGLPLVTTAAQKGSTLREYGEWYRTDAIHALPTVDHFYSLAGNDGRVQEAHLWHLIRSIFEDSERAERYHPDAMKIHSTQPQRRWFISHYAHLQDLLQRNSLLRHAVLVCRWLEFIYRNVHRTPMVRGEEDIVLRQVLLTYIRGGELHKAIEAAVLYGEGSYSCVLAAAQLQTVREPWFTQTEVVPLFGEYAHGELDAAWCGNEHRLDNLSQLYEDSVSLSSGEAPRDARSGFDAVIGAALCGNLAVLETAFDTNRSWQDTAWCALRCFLTVAFTKTLMNAGVPVDGPYAAFVESQTHGDDQWLSQFAQRMVKQLSQRLHETFLPTASLEEQLQMRFILQTLTPADAAWFNVSPETSHVEAVCLVTHVLLALDAAYTDTLCDHAVQVHAGEILTNWMTQYAIHLAQVRHYPLEEGMQTMVAMTRPLRDPRHRARVYAAFVLAARDVCLSRQEMTTSQLEEKETRLVRIFVEADTTPGVHEEVQRCLNQQVAPEEMLTHNKVAERILWESMHADSAEDYTRIVRSGLEACVEFWLQTPHAELEAIADVSRILRNRVRPALLGDGRESCLDDHCAASAITEMEWAECDFWHEFSEAREVATQHTKAAGGLGSARSSMAVTRADRTILFRLAQEEAALLTRLVHLTQLSVRHGGAVVLRSPSCLNAVVWLVQQLTEDVTLTLLNTDLSVDTVPYLQAVFALVEQLDESGYLVPELIPEVCAADLYSRIRTMRVAHGKRVHRKQVTAALERAATMVVTERDGALLAS